MGFSSLSGMPHGHKIAAAAPGIQTLQRESRENNGFIICILFRKPSAGFCLDFSGHKRIIWLSSAVRELRKRLPGKEDLSLQLA